MNHQTKLSFARIVCHQIGRVGVVVSGVLGSLGVSHAGQLRARASVELGILLNAPKKGSAAVVSAKGWQILKAANACKGRLGKLLSVTKMAGMVRKAICGVCQDRLTWNGVSRPKAVSLPTAFGTNFSTGFHVVSNPIQQ